MNMGIFCVILIIMTKVSLVVVSPTDAFYDPDGKIVFLFWEFEYNNKKHE